MAVATTKGFKIYSLMDENELKLLFSTQELGCISLIEMQFSSNIVAMVLKYPSEGRESAERRDGYRNSVVSV